MKTIFWKKFSRFLLIGLSIMVLVAGGQRMVLDSNQQSPKQVLAEEDNCLDPNNPGCAEPGFGGEVPDEPTTPPTPSCTNDFKYNECVACNTSRPVYTNSCSGAFSVGPNQSDSACGSWCASTTPPPPAQQPPAQQPSSPQAPDCDSGQVSMNVSPNSARIGDSVTFSVSGSQGSTWIGDSWSGGVDCSGTFWGSKTCRATTAGNFQWTHTWQNTAPNNFDIKSPQCSRSVNFTVQSNVVSPPSCTPNGSCSVQTPTSCGQTNTGVDNCGNVCVRQSAACPAQGGVNINNTNTNTSSSTSSSSNTNNITFGNVGTGTSQPVVVQPQVAGVAVSTLPKTGLPALAWSALALVPVGFRMRRFNKIKKELEDDPQFIWEDRQFKSGA